MNEPSPKWRRQKESRPVDIVQAALSVFAEKGFAGARMEEIAARAGVSKGAPYLYFATKEDLFRAVVQNVVEPDISMVLDMASRHEGPLEPLFRAMTQHIAHMAETTQIGRVVKLVISESSTFPEIARIWHDTVIDRALGTLGHVLQRAQARGDARPGEPRNQALSIIAPLVVGVLYGETFGPTGATRFDLRQLMQQHLDTLLPGLLVGKEDS